MSVSVKCLQITVSVLCFLMMILGILLLVMGIMAYNVYHSEENANVASISYIVVGSFIVAVAIFGLIGAICKNYCLLIIYCILLAIVFLLCTIFMIFAFITPGVYSEFYEDGYKTAMKRYNDRDTRSREYVDHAQRNFQCCGYLNYTEWAVSGPDFERGVLPLSCCVEKAKSCNINHNFYDVHKKGCKSNFVEEINKKYYGLGIAAAVTSAVLLITLILASILTSKVKHEV